MTPGSLWRTTEQRLQNTSLTPGFTDYIHLVINRTTQWYAFALSDYMYFKDIKKKSLGLER